MIASFDLGLKLKNSKQSLFTISLSVFLVPTIASFHLGSKLKNSKQSLFTISLSVSLVQKQIKTETYYSLYLKAT